MAHFAELNSSNEVLQVVVISNDDVNANGGDKSSQAETFVASLVPYTTGGVAWKQTSYNNNFKNNTQVLVIVMMQVKINLFALNLILLGL